MWKARGGSWIQRASIQRALPISSFLFTDSTCVHTPALVKVGRTSFFCFFTNSAGIDCTHDGQGITLEAQTQSEQRKCAIYTSLDFGFSSWAEVAWYLMVGNASKCWLLSGYTKHSVLVCNKSRNKQVNSKLQVVVLRDYDCPVDHCIQTLSDSAWDRVSIE